MEGVEWHLTCNEIEAWVSVKKKALPQYSEGRDELNNEVTCWIPSEADNVYLSCLPNRQLTEIQLHRLFA